MYYLLPDWLFHGHTWAQLTIPDHLIWFFWPEKMFRLRKLGTQKLFLEPPKSFWSNINFSPQENVRVWPWSAIACFHFLFFSWKGMLIRSTLAALDFNFNVNRKDKLSSSGQPLFKIKVGNWLLVLYFLRLHCVYGHSCFFTRTHNYSQEEKLFL